MLRNILQNTHQRTRKSEEQNNKNSGPNAPNCSITIKRTRAAGLSTIVLFFRFCIGCDVDATWRHRLRTVVLGKFVVRGEVVLDALGESILAVGELCGPLIVFLVLVRAP